MRLVVSSRGLYRRSHDLISARDWSVWVSADRRYFGDGVAIVRRVVYHRPRDTLSRDVYCRPRDTLHKGRKRKEVHASPTHHPIMLPCVG